MSKDFNVLVAVITVLVKQSITYKKNLFKPRKNLTWM